MIFAQRVQRCIPVDGLARRSVGFRGAADLAPMAGNYSADFDCDPTIPGTVCGSKCTLDSTSPCPKHQWECYGENHFGDQGFEENEGMCDCTIFYGCAGASCEENNSLMTWWWIFAGTALLGIGLITFLRLARLLVLMIRAGKLSRGATSQCLVYCTFGELFGMIYWFDITLRRPLTCADGIDNGWWYFSGIVCSAAFAMFAILACITIALMWIDVYVKSKAMQKVTTKDSLVEKMKLFLQGFSVFFVVVFCLLYVGAGGATALAFTFLPAIGVATTFPAGGARLSNVLTGEEKNFCSFVSAALPLMLFGKRTQARTDLIASFDLSSSSGKFQQSRMHMAEMVEKTAIRAWVCIITFIFFGVGYAVSSSGEGEHTAGEMYPAAVCWFLMFLPLGVAVNGIYGYMRFQLRDVVTPSTRKVVAGISMNNTTSTETEADSADSSTETQKNRKLSATV